MKQQVINGRSYSIYAHDAIISDLTSDVENLTAQLNNVETSINQLIRTINPNDFNSNVVWSELYRIKNLLKIVAAQAKVK